MPSHYRVNWEFFAVLTGEVGVLLDRQPPDFRVRTLWILAPGCAHGWVGKKGQPCEVVVFHFSMVSHVLERLMPESGCLGIPLRKAEMAALQRLHTQLLPHYWKPTVASQVYADKALAELTLLGMGGLPQSNARVSRHEDMAPIAKVEEWIQAHISIPPTVRGAAQATGMSESSLYRLFREVRGTSPQQAILKFKVDRAAELMATHDAKLDEIAPQCGFSNASALCRAFKSLKGCSPKTWQQEIHIQYQRPAKRAAENHTLHGRRRNFEEVRIRCA